MNKKKKGVLKLPLDKIQHMGSIDNSQRVNEKWMDEIWTFLYELAPGDVLKDYYKNLSAKEFDCGDTFCASLLENVQSMKKVNFLSRKHATTKIIKHIRERMKQKNEDQTKKGAKELLCTFGCTGSGKTRALYETLVNENVLNELTQKENNAPVIRLVVSYGNEGEAQECEKTDGKTAVAGFGWRLLLSMVLAQYNKKGGITKYHEGKQKDDEARAEFTTVEKLLNELSKKVSGWDELTLDKTIAILYGHRGINPQSPILVAVDEIFNFMQPPVKTREGSLTPIHSPKHNSNSNSNTRFNFYDTDEPVYIVSHGEARMDQETKYVQWDNEELLNNCLRGTEKILREIGLFYNNYANKHPLVVFMISSLFDAHYSGRTASNRELCKVELQLLSTKDMLEEVHKSQFYQAIKTAPKKKQADRYINFLIDQTKGFPCQFSALMDHIKGKWQVSAKDMVAENHRNAKSRTQLIIKDMDEDLDRRYKRLKAQFGKNTCNLIEMFGISDLGNYGEVKLSNGRRILMKDLLTCGMVKETYGGLVFPPRFLMKFFLDTKESNERKANDNGESDNGESDNEFRKNKPVTKRQRMNTTNRNKNENEEDENEDEEDDDDDDDDDDDESEEQEDYDLDGISLRPARPGINWEKRNSGIYITLETLFDVPYDANEIGGKCLEERLYCLDFLKSGYYPLCRKTINGYYYYGRECTLSEWFHYGIRANNQTMKQLCENKKYFIPSMDDILPIEYKNAKQQLQLRRSMRPGAIYFGKETNFPAVDYGFLIYDLDSSNPHWCVLWIQARQTVVNPDKKKMGKSEMDKIEAKFKTFTSKYFNDTILVVCASKSIVSTFDKYNYKRVAFSTDDFLQRSFGAQFDDVLRWTRHGVLDRHGTKVDNKNNNNSNKNNNNSNKTKD